MKRVALISLLTAVLALACNAGKDKDGSVAWEMLPVGAGCDTVSIGDMDIKNPFIIYDDLADIYYMTGDNGNVWTSRELRTWVGPYNVLNHDTASWVGADSVITSPEIHEHNGKYYYMASFERGGKRSCTTFVANNVAGPYRTIGNSGMLLDVRETAAHPTFCSDEYGAGYMIYARSAVKESCGAVQIIRYTDDLGERIGEAFVMFRASDVPWQRDEELMPLLESPVLFYSGEEGLGILFTAYCGSEMCIGAAYSETGTLNGPWIVEKEPLLRGYESVTMFSDYDGTPVLLASKALHADGKVKRVPVLFKTDLQFEKIEIKGQYKF